MIGALLSNTPANLLRNSGVAGDPATGPGDSDQDREPPGVRDSQASARTTAARAGNGPVLTPQAVLALQDVGDADLSSRRLSEGQGRAAPPEADDGSGNAAGETAEDEATGQGNRPAQVAEDVGQPGAEEQGEEDSDGDGLNEAEEKQVEKLKQRDREVRAHEQAHARAGGAYAGPPSYSFQQGPDGKRYAVGGEVQIDTSTERTPEATIRKMRVVISAALAPAEPSGQDLSVAQQARAQLSEAQAELRQQKLEDLKGEETQPGGTGETAEVPKAETQTASGRQDSGTEDSVDRGDADSTGRARSTVRADEAALAVNAYQEALQRAGAIQAYSA